LTPTQLPEPPNVTERVVRTLVLYCLAEFQLGHARQIRVSARGHSFSVGDDGRGHAVDRTVDGTPYLKFIYSHLEYPFRAAESGAVQLQGLGMSLLNGLCSELTATVVTKAASLHLRFHDGKLVSQEFNEVGAESTGNTISGTVDTRLESRAVDERQLEEWLGTLLAANPELKLSFNGQEPPGLPLGDA
jgi:DNA gyrase/topoisomerase IV subunit B